MDLSSTELEIIRAVGFDVEVARQLRLHTDATIERLSKLIGLNEARCNHGLSIAIPDGTEAERLMNAVQGNLLQLGYRSFWSKRYGTGSEKATDELVILQTTDSIEIVRLCRSNGANYGVSNSDVINRLAEWSRVCAFDVVGASHDWVAIVFSRLPEDICAFADEIYVFCPDAVGQGVGLTKEKDAPEAFAAARRLCPEVATKPVALDESLRARMSPESFERARQMMEMLAKQSTPTDMGVRLLAHTIYTTKFLFLWWD